MSGFLISTPGIVISMARMVILMSGILISMERNPHQTHRAGETLFVDYAGQTVPVTNRDTGELREAQIFIAVLGASNYTFARASWPQSLPDWIDAHCRAFRFFGGVPETLVPDNLKTGVTHPHRYEPELKETPRLQTLTVRTHRQTRP